MFKKIVTKPAFEPAERALCMPTENSTASVARLGRRGFQELDSLALHYKFLKSGRSAFFK
ncbi:MAG: hypothetical protein C5B46_01805 [Proteobacteria bacterium]|nr:MAG: hypothetical protein C5B46_01805 [Pseudomonadota bacterium]